jgi:hypothetical protein
MLHDHADVTGTEPFFGEISREYDALVWRERHRFSSGISVTSRGTVSPLGMIQIVRTHAVAPLGPVKRP